MKSINLIPTTPFYIINNTTTTTTTFTITLFPLKNPNLTPRIPGLQQKINPSTQPQPPPNHLPQKTQLEPHLPPR